MQSGKNINQNSIVENTKKMDVELNDNYAILNFPLRKENNDSYVNSLNKDILNQVQKKIHPNIPEQNFVHDFNDNNQDSILSHVGRESFESAFVSMAHVGFAKHRGVTIRPDDLHLLIIQGFARFLQQYPENFRESVVAFTGKKLIKISNFDPSQLAQWNFLPKGFAGLIKNYLTHPELSDYLLQDYSQTTELDKTAKAVTLMGTFSAYFNFVASTMCYIPKFILQGTVEDWNKLVDLPKKINEILNLAAAEQNNNGLKLLHRWLTRLQPMLDKMQAARNGEMDASFWDSFYKFESHSGRDKVTGNIAYFYPFLKKMSHDRYDEPNYKAGAETLKLNKYIMEDAPTLGTSNGYREQGPSPADFPANVIGVDFKLLDENDTVEYEMGMKAGIVTFKDAVLKDINTKALQTHVDYSIFYKNKVHASNALLRSQSKTSNPSQEKTSEFMHDVNKNIFTNANDKVESKVESDTSITSANDANINISNSNIFQKPKKKIVFELEEVEEKVSQNSNRNSK